MQLLNHCHVPDGVDQPLPLRSLGHQHLPLLTSRQQARSSVSQEELRDPSSLFSIDMPALCLIYVGSCSPYFLSATARPSVPFAQAMPLAHHSFPALKELVLRGQSNTFKTITRGISSLPQFVRNGSLHLPCQWALKANLSRRHRLLSLCESSNSMRIPPVTALLKSSPRSKPLENPKRCTRPLNTPLTCS